MREPTGQKGGEVQGLYDGLAFVGIIVALMLTIAMLFTAGWERPPIDSQQLGFRGVGMVESQNPRMQRELQEANAVPAEPWPLELPAEGDPRAGDLYENVQVLGHLGEDQFTRLMTAITEWVAPEEGCGYCHNLENLADDSIYTKIVARRMIQMTQHINADWTDHVGATGVTCYTCHRGQAVPAEVYFEDNSTRMFTGALGNRNGQNMPGNPTAGFASLPTDPLTPFILNDQNIRVNATTALPAGTTEKGIYETEWVFSLMMHMSSSLGVNCTYCHNSRQFATWEESPPARTTAWHGIRMARDLNNEYFVPLGPQYPAHRLGPEGDAPKANCATCHNGVNKPLYGAQMVKDYPSLMTLSPQ